MPHACPLKKEKERTNPTSGARPSLLLLLLSHFSRVRLCATPSLGISRQEHWSGLPFPSPMHESEVAQSCLTLRDPMDCSLPGSSVHGIFQARALEWGATAFSKAFPTTCIYNHPQNSFLNRDLQIRVENHCHLRSVSKYVSLPVVPSAFSFVHNK